MEIPKRSCIKLILFLTIFFQTLSGQAKDYPLSDHYNGDVFFNTTQNQLLSFWDILAWKLKGTAAKWPKGIKNNSYPFLRHTGHEKAVVTFINHASFLLQLNGLNILTDPIFSQRASPSSFFGPERVRAPGLGIDDLPAIDIVIISHNHYDHLDLTSLRDIDSKFKPIFFVPLGNKKLLAENGIQNIHEMDWWNEHTIKQSKITFTPVQHWSARGLFDKCKSLWGGYYIKSDEFSFYFGGDAGYSTYYSDTRNKLGSPDVALLPIGAYDPENLMRINHMTPEDALRAHHDLGAKLSIGMHFGTFQLTDEPFEEPVKRIKQSGVSNFISLDVGESKVFN